MPPVVKQDNHFPVPPTALAIAVDPCIQACFDTNFVTLLLFKLRLSKALHLDH